MIKRSNNSVDSEFESLVNPGSLTSAANNDSGESITGTTKKANKIVILMGVITGCLVVLSICFKIGMSKVDASEAAKEAYKATQIQEPHSSLTYYLTEEQVEDSVEAAGFLIAHVMETGCSLAYSPLLEMFTDSSLEQLYSYLKGRNCTEYSRAQVVRIKESNVFYEYMVKLSRNSKDYIVRVNHDDFRPTEFSITEYVQ